MIIANLSWLVQKKNGHKSDVVGTIPASHAFKNIHSV